MSSEVARDQLGEPVPLIPIRLIKIEHQRRLELARALSTQTMIETSLHQYPEIDNFKLLAKQHLHQFSKALFDFGEAKRAIRKHVPDKAMVIKT